MTIIPMPAWVKPRLGWKFVGWIPRDPLFETFEELVEDARKSDHGELREVDIYPQGAAAWIKERTKCKS